MAGPTELSFDAVREFMLQNGGRVRNYDLVKHFKKFLTVPETRDEARNYFKEIVNNLALIRNENNEKFLVLKKKYRPPGYQLEFPSPVNSPLPSYDTFPTSSRHHHTSQDSLTSPSRHQKSPESFSSLPRQPPPYRAPPPPVNTPPPPYTPSPTHPSPTYPFPSPNNRHLVRSLTYPDNIVPFDNSPPVVPPRRKSSASSADRLKVMEEETVLRSRENALTGRPMTLAIDETDSDEKISVKERMQKFQVESPVSASVSPQNATKKKSEKDDDDAVSVTSMDPKTKEWLIHAARGDFHYLSKLADESPRLAKVKDPATGYTALHWGAKHGNADIVKLIAGHYKVSPNIRTNGGYTPCHLAMQFSHEDIFNLLVQVYGADSNLRDWSGRKPRQYQISLDTSVSVDTYRKIKARKKHAKTEKESLFLRIGSFNVRVKKTKASFSNYFLGQSDKMHKTWGSADNIAQQGEKKTMQPPKYGPIKKRKSKREVDFASSRSTPTTPTQNRASITSMTSMRSNVEPNDSDSDTAAGFGANWKG